MTNRRYFNKAILCRLARIERKCDFLISEMSAVINRMSERDSVSDAIDRLHEAARSLREQSAAEKRRLRDKFGM